MTRKAINSSEAGAAQLVPQESFRVKLKKSNLLDKENLTNVWRAQPRVQSPASKLSGVRKSASKAFFTLYYGGSGYYVIMLVLNSKIIPRFM